MEIKIFCFRNFSFLHWSHSSTHCINLHVEERKVSENVVALVTDSAANIVAAARITAWKHVPCFAHILRQGSHNDANKVLCCIHCVEIKFSKLIGEVQCSWSKNRIKTYPRVALHCVWWCWWKHISYIMHWCDTRLCVIVKGDLRGVGAPFLTVICYILLFNLFLYLFICKQHTNLFILFYEVYISVRKNFYFSLTLGSGLHHSTAYYVWQSVAIIL